MKRVLFACALLLVLSFSAACVRAENYAGTWTVQSQNASSVHLRLEYRKAGAFGTEEWDESRDVPLGQLRGITVADLDSNGIHKGFTIVRDAGEMRADGWLSNGRGSGSWTFVPNPAFASQLARRGVGAPSEKQQFQLAMGNFKLATLDMLLGNGFERPSIDDLVAMSEHGVSDDYINGVKNVPLHPKSVRELIRMRDHGVDAEYAAEMMARDPQATAEDIVELRDHGVSTRYMNALVSHGYSGVTVDQAERMRDHGVSEEYITGLQRIGYHPSADELIHLVDHGVSIAFIERMRSHGYTKLSVDDLIRLRDHGF